MDKTNYRLLSIVAIVAITAIVAMFIHAQRSSAIPAGPTIVFEKGEFDEASLTGLVVGDERVERPAETERARPELDWTVHDYNSDSALNEKDVAIFDEVLARTRFCPQQKNCDVNGDGTIDSADRRMLLAAMLRIEAESAEQHTILTATLSKPTSAHATLGIAAAGVPFS